MWPVAAALETALVDAVGAAHVLTDPDLTAPYETDWTRRWTGRARAVVRPADTEQVVAVVRACAEAGVPVVPQGGNTGLVGAAVPTHGEVVLSTRRLTRLDPVDPLSGQVTVGAGVTLAGLQQHAKSAGWAYGVDLAARDSATVGGTVATNAGGVRVVKHGMTRAQVLGIEAVLADGSVVSHLQGLLKDNTGYDLEGLLTGSEGTLGIITAVRMRLVRPETGGEVVLVGLPDVRTALEVVAGPGRAAGLRAAEVLLAPCLDLVRQVTGLPAPLERSDWPAVLLMETDELPELDDDVDAAVDPGLWHYRERLTESISTVGVPHKLDVSLPAATMPHFVAALPAAVAPHTAYVFGHLADGNLHVNVLGPEPDDETVDDAVLRLVAAHGGSVSAEHGIGRAKTAWLGLSRSPAELAAMRAVKTALDPAGLFSPGVLLPAG